ncbi:MAG: acyl-CoA dehydrogenase family protein [Parachlamydiaceae bacterium]|nr:acyl-CoA dehydrogenase family protein [Parachlamydiaceae bacterium]
MDEQQRKLAEELFATSAKCGFAKGFYLGAFNGQNVFPYPQISAEEKTKTDAFLVKVTDFAENQIDGDAIDRQASIPDSVIQGLADLGVLGMTIPPEYGGLGMSQYAYCRVAEVISRKCASTALFLNAHQSIGLKALLLFGTETQKQKWLPFLAKGKYLAAFSLTEPTAGSDASGIQTRAIYDKDKKVWLLTGNKQWTTNGAIADVLTVMARTEIDTPQGKQDKITAFLVSPKMPGFKVTAAALEKVGMRGSKTANLSFTDLEVPEENILGPLGGGLRVCLTVLDFGRTTFGATCLGAARYLVQRAIEHAKTRYQFNRPLASFSLVKQKIATMSCLIYAMESTTYLTAGFIDHHVEDFMLESAILKVFASDALWAILYDTMQIFGGRSFFTDQPFERMMRDARLNMIGEGSNEVMRAFIGAIGMRDVGAQLKSSLDAIMHPIDRFSTLQSSITHWASRITPPNVPLISPELQNEAIILGKKIRTFGIAVTKLLIYHREEIIENQLQLNRIATSAIALYTASAVLSRIDADLNSTKERTSLLLDDLAIAKLYCTQAFRTIDMELSAINNNCDAEIEALSDQLTGQIK